MGGKAKPAQRTKGNMRPASSSASFQLNSAGFTPLDVGLTSSIVSAFSEDIIDIDSSVDSGFQIILKKMTKKDPTTKIKALKEFVDLVNTSEVDVVKTVLAYLPKVYVQLSVDVDARVRESSQNALLAIVNKVGKHLATILKQVFPAWVCAQYDTHPPASSIASNCFVKAFPSKKVSDVFAFCESECLEYFTKNLTVLTSQTVCNPKAHTPEECEGKYQRVLISSLRGYALYLERISPEKLEQSKEKNLGLIDKDKFWSLHKNKLPQIRSAFFEALTSLLKNGSFLLEKHEEQVTSIVFKSIDETDPALLSHIWVCLILVQVKVRNWSQYININKMLLPKLWKILRNALFPCIIYPNLLPFMSEFNTTMMPEDPFLQNFYTRFFENINYGLRNTQMGKSETSAVTSHYFEILRFVIMKVANDNEVPTETKLEFCCKLVDDHIIAVIFWCIQSEGSYGKHIFHHIASLLSFWSRNANTVQLYQILMQRFWSELYQVLEDSLETSTVNIGKVTSSHVELTKSLKLISQAPKLKSVQIKFEDSEPISSSRIIDPLDEPESQLSKAQELNDLVYKLCAKYVERISTTREREFVESLEALVKEYQSEELFIHLAKSNNSEHMHSLYDTFSAWLREEELHCESVVEIILVLYKYIKASEKIDLLNRWIKVKSVQSWIILRALSYPLCMEPDITKLLRMPEVTEHLVDCAKQVANGIYKENLIILQKCFFQTEDGNILIDISTCSKIIDILCNPLTDQDKIKQMDKCGSFLAQIFSVICSDPEKKELQNKIFLSLFELSLRLTPSPEELSEDTLWEVTTAWQDSLSSNDIAMNENVLEACATIIKRRHADNSLTGKITIIDMEHLTEITSKLIMCSTEQEGSVNAKLAVVELMTSKLRFQRGDDEFFLENLASTVELLHGRVVLDDIEDVCIDDNFTEVLDAYMKRKIFNLDVIIRISCNVAKKSNTEKTDDEEEEEATEDYCDMDENLLKDWTDQIFDRFIDICYSEAVLNVILLNSKTLQPELEDWILYLQERLKTFMIYCPEKILVQLKEKLFEVSNSKGGLWSKVLLNLLNTKTYNSEDGYVLLYEDSVSQSSLSQPENLISYINILQTFASSFEHKKILPITTNLFEQHASLLVKVSASRSLIKSHLTVGDYNEMGDRKVVGNALIVMNEVLTKQKVEPYLLYNKDVSLEDCGAVLQVAEIAHFLTDILTLFPTELDVKRWDFIRIALSSWVLSVSKSCKSFNQNKVKVFVSAIFKLNAALAKFIINEKTKSSTELLQNVIDEWEKVFAKDVSLVLIKSFVHIINNLDYDSKHQEFFVDSLSPYVGSIDFSFVIHSQKVDSTFSLSDLIAFALKNLSNKYRGICITSATILKQLTPGLIKHDQELNIQRNSEDITSKNDDNENMENNRWHNLDRFRQTLENYQDVMSTFIEDFSFKVNEMDDLSFISPSIAFSYLLLWDCILNFCSKAPAELRSIYARWITIHEFEETFLVSLFKLMPRDVIVNSEASVIGHIAFSTLEWKDIENSKIDNERYSSFLYAECLRTVPAVVRKWWHASNTRKAQLVEKITQNYVSPILCQQDLTVLTTRKERDGKDNMQIRVLMQSREIFATYSLDEAKMELSISLPSNYPLGAIKIDSTKHIAGKLQAREIVKQLSIYLTHQNGRLFDGISLWKRNLDRKYEGVEECFVCYSVINQETCQLPRLTCKTCKKKFHSNCLYKWFTTSNKSTCPLCRNVF